MANATINSGASSAQVTVTNSTDGAGTPSQNENNVTVVATNATVSTGFFGGAFYDVNFFGGNDVLLAQNVPWVNPDFGDSVGFDQINTGSGNDSVDLERSGFLDLDLGSGDDTLVLDSSGGQTANLGIGNDLAQVDFSDALNASEEELAQKSGQPLLDLDGQSGLDTLELGGDWTVTLTTGDVLIDPGNDGIDTTLTNIFTSAQLPDIQSMPALLSGSVQWANVTTLSSGDTVHPAVAFSNFETIDTICFTAGTLIDTPDGAREITTLKVDDLVITRDGPKPIRWIGKRRLDIIDLAANIRLLPIRIPAGALGPKLPKTDLSVSPQHRVAIDSEIAKSMFGNDEVLVAAKHLIGLNGIDVDGEVDGVVYVHMMLDEHEVIFANGMPAETLLPGPQALEMLPDSALREIKAIFPDIEKVMNDYAAHACLPILKGREGRALAARLQKSYEHVSDL